jgi:hypothetical protein
MGEFERRGAAQKADDRKALSLRTGNERQGRYAAEDSQEAPPIDDGPHAANDLFCWSSQHTTPRWMVSKMGLFKGWSEQSHSMSTQI